MRSYVLQRTFGLLTLLALALVVSWSISQGLWIVPIVFIGLILAIIIVGASFRHPGWAITAFFFTLPFERIPSLQIGESTVRISQILLLTLLLVATCQILFQKRHHFSLSPYVLPYLIFIGALVLSFINMEAKGRGMMVFIFILFTSLSTWVVPYFVESERSLWRVIRALFIVSILISIFGLYQFIGDMIGLPTSLTGLRELYTKVVFGFPRVQATQLEPLYLANFLITPLSLAVSFAARQVKIFSNSFVYLLIFLGGLTFILTLSRGGYIGLMFSLSLIVASSLFSILRPKVMMGSLAALFIIAIGVSGLFAFSSLSEDSIRETTRHFTEIQLDASTLHRFSTFDQAWQAYQESPITGVGIGNFGPWVANYPSELPRHGWAIVNNEPLELLAETGIIGFLAFILLMSVLIARSVFAIIIVKDSTLRATMIGLLAALLGVLTQYQFFSTLYVIYVWALFGLIIAVQNLIYKHKT